MTPLGEVEISNQPNGDVIWYCSCLFSSISLNNFYKVLLSVMLEKSVVFVSENLGLLTSSVLGIYKLLKPFQWPHVIVPVLPYSLYEILDAPVPVLLGV